MHASAGTPISFAACSKTSGSRLARGVDIVGADHAVERALEIELLEDHADPVVWRRRNERRGDAAVVQFGEEVVQSVERFGAFRCGFPLRPR